MQYIQSNKISQAMKAGGQGLIRIINEGFLHVSNRYDAYTVLVKLCCKIILHTALYFKMPNKMQKYREWCKLDFSWTRIPHSFSETHSQQTVVQNISHEQMIWLIICYCRISTIKSYCNCCEPAGYGRALKLSITVNANAHLIYVCNKMEDAVR